MHVTFINLFIVPLIGTYLFCRKEQYKLSFSFETLFLYAYFTSFNILGTHCFLILARKLLNRIIVTESALYTLFAIISSVIIYFISVIISECLNIELKIKKNKDEKNE